MAIYDPTSSIGNVIASIGANVTGSLTISLFVVVALCILTSVAFGLPIEITAPVVLPVMVVAAILTSQMVPVLGVTLIYLAVLFVKSLVFK